MLTAEQQAKLDSAALFERFRTSEFLSILTGILEELEELGLMELHSYSGSDPYVLFKLKLQWHAPGRLKGFIDGRIAEEIAKFDEVADELGLTLEELKIRSEMYGR